MKSSAGEGQGKPKAAESSQQQTSTQAIPVRAATAEASGDDLAASFGPGSLGSRRLPPDLSSESSFNGRRQGNTHNMLMAGDSDDEDHQSRSFFRHQPVSVTQSRSTVGSYSKPFGVGSLTQSDRVGGEGSLKKPIGSPLIQSDPVPATFLAANKKSNSSFSQMHMSGSLLSNLDIHSPVRQSETLLNSKPGSLAQHGAFPSGSSHMSQPDLFSSVRTGDAAPVPEKRS